MNNDNTPTVSYKDTPPDFSPCFVSECPKRAECIRYAVGQTFPPGPRMGICVFPQSLQDGECSYFYPVRTIREAWGFDPLFYDVKARDETPLRQSIERYVGSRSAYFRYNHGIRTLTPEQQDDILQLFAERGYDTSELHFANYRETIDYHVD